MTSDLNSDRHENSDRLEAGFPIDEARKRPRNLDEEQPDVGAVAQDETDLAPPVPSGSDAPGEHHEANDLPGDESAIYQRGTIIQPPS